MGASCTLDTEGLFRAVGGNDAGIDVCIEFCESGPDTPADAGSGGNAGEPVDASIYDSCDCGVGGAGGEAGQGGTAGTGGEAGQGGVAGQGGTAGAGGNAGQGGIGGAGGEAGQGGTGGQGGSGGEAGAGGSGGTTTCDPGQSGTPSSVSVTGLSQTSAYVHFYGGTSQYDNLTPSSLPLAGNTLPAEVVLSGLNGLTITFTGGDPVPLYGVTVSSTAACAGSSYYSQACEAKVAQDFRCQFFPSEEPSCSDVTVTFSSLGLQSAYNVENLGNNKVLASIRCEP